MLEVLVAVATTFVGAVMAAHCVLTTAELTMAQPFAFVTVTVSVTLGSVGVKVIELVVVLDVIVPPVICHANVAEPFAGTDAVCPAAQARLLPTVIVALSPDVALLRPTAKIGNTSSLGSPALPNRYRLAGKPPTLRL